MASNTISVVITDLDNTIFDWFEFWYASFNAMLDELARQSGVPRDQLIAEAREVHQLHGTSEYAFLIEELPSLKRKHPGEDLVQIYDSAIHAYRSERKRHLHLYPGVMETLEALRDYGCLIVAYTESMGFYSAERLRRLSLDGIIHFLYSQEDHDFPAGMTPEQIRMYPEEYYQLKLTKHRHTPRGQLKPDPKLLLGIARDVGARIDQTIYIGDSLSKDIVMAQKARVIDVFASYGPAHTNREYPERYDLLRAVTHWTSEQVEQERRLSESDVTPSYVVNESFEELLGLFHFTRHS